MESYPNTQEILQNKYKTEEFLKMNSSLVKKVINQKFYFFNNTYDYQDLIQEGVIVLYNAMLHYDNIKGKWSSYAYSIISNRLLSKIQLKENKLKIYNQNIKSLDKETSTIILYDKENIENKIINKITKQEKVEKIKSQLGKKGKKVFEQILNSKSRKEIATEINVTTQCIDDHIKTIKKYAKIVNQGA